MIEPLEIIEARHAGEIRYGAVSDWSGDLNRVLSKFGLTPDAALLVEHDRAGATSILTALLWKDMAYETPNTTEAKAGAMAESILSSYANTDSRYYSNGNWAKRESWNPLTESTFDAGLIVTAGKNLYFCIWFQDED